MIGNTYHKMIFVALVLSSTVLMTDALLEEIFGVGLEAVCAVASANDIKKCGEVFNHEMESVNNQGIYELQKRKFCCSFNHLKDCILESIGDKCGQQKDSIADKLVSTTVTAVKAMTNVDCKLYSKTTGTVLCLNDILLVGLTLGLILVMLFVCCGTIKMCCRSNRRRDSGHFLLLPNVNKDRF